MSRLHVSWYNRPRRFDNGVVWFMVSVRLRRWHNVFGARRARSWPFVSVYFPWSRNLRRSSAGPTPVASREASS